MFQTLEHALIKNSLNIVESGIPTSRHKICFSESISSFDLPLVAWIADAIVSHYFSIISLPVKKRLLRESRQPFFQRSDTAPETETPWVVPRFLKQPQQQAYSVLSLLYKFNRFRTKNYSLIDLEQKIIYSY